MYVVGILIAKFFINLDFLADDPGLVSTYTSLNNWVLFGLWRVETVWGLFLYVLPEIVILTAIMSQSYHEILLGLHEKRETALEGVEQAKERFLNQFNQDEEQERALSKAQKKHLLIEEEDEAEDEDHGLTYDERIVNYRVELAPIRAEVVAQDQNELYEKNFRISTSQWQKNKSEFTEEIQKFLPFERKYSLVIDMAERRSLIKKLKAKRPENQGVIKNFFAGRPLLSSSCSAFTRFPR